LAAKQTSLLPLHCAIDAAIFKNAFFSLPFSFPFYFVFFSKELALKKKKKTNPQKHLSFRCASE